MLSIMIAHGVLITTKVLIYQYDIEFKLRSHKP